MLYRFKSPFVYTQKVNNHEFIKAQLMPHILSFYTQHKDDPDYHWADSQTINNHHQQDLSVFTEQMYKDIVWDPVDAMLIELNQTPSPARSHIAGMWWNIYPAGSFAQVHDHRGYDLSGAYFLHMNEPNTLMFEPQCNDGFFPFTYDILATHDITQEGYVAIFPSSLKHYVNPCKEMRVTISFNLSCDVMTDEDVIKENPHYRMMKLRGKG